jgi:hypothetical protein
MKKHYTWFLALFLLPISVHAQVIPSKCLQYAPLIEQYDWNYAIAASIMAHESSCDPSAVNASSTTGDDSYGLFQVNLYGNLAKSRPSAEWLSNPANNVAYAYSLYSAPFDPASTTDTRITGFTPWETSLAIALKDM